MADKHNRLVGFSWFVDPLDVLGAVWGARVLQRCSGGWDAMHRMDGGELHARQGCLQGCLLSTRTLGRLPSQCCYTARSCVGWARHPPIIISKLACYLQVRYVLGRPKVGTYLFQLGSRYVRGCWSVECGAWSRSLELWWTPGHPFARCHIFMQLKPSILLFVRADNAWTSTIP